MEIAQIITRLRVIEKEYKSDGFDVYSVYNNDGYNLTITKDDEMSVLIRDTYSAESEHIDITSFDVVFKTGGYSYLNYISDYPDSEYLQRLEEVYDLIGSFFKKQFTVTSEPHLFFTIRDT